MLFRAAIISQTSRIPRCYERSLDAECVCSQTSFMHLWQVQDLSRVIEVPEEVICTASSVTVTCKVFASKSEAINMAYLLSVVQDESTGGLHPGDLQTGLESSP